MAKCKCKFPIMVHIEGQGFKCKECGLWVIKSRKVWFPTRVAEPEDKSKYDRKKEKRVDEE